jgi:hypothetical protein
MVIKFLYFFIIIATITVFTGCGVIYTNTIRPKSTDFKSTPIGTKSCAINAYRLKEPVSRLGLSGEWDTKDIINAAKEAGITEIYYTEMHTLSILFSSYRRKTLIIYGK